MAGIEGIPMNSVSKITAKLLLASLFCAPLALAADDNTKDGDKDKQTPAAQAPATTDQKDQKAEDKKTGGKNDVDAIGNRNIGNRGLGNWYTLEKEIRM